MIPTPRMVTRSLWGRWQVTFVDYPRIVMVSLPITDDPMEGWPAPSMPGVPQRRITPAGDPAPPADWWSELVVINRARADRLAADLGRFLDGIGGSP